MAPSSGGEPPALHNLAGVLRITATRWGWSVKVCPLVVVEYYFANPVRVKRPAEGQDLIHFDE